MIFLLKYYADYGIMLLFKIWIIANKKIIQRLFVLKEICMKVVVDAFGGDKAPKEIILGCVDALNEQEELELILVGKEDIIREELASAGYNGDRVTILNASDVITCNDAPVEAIKTKTDSSIVVALNELKAHPEYAGFVSAGSTGAVLTGAFLKLGRIKGVLRPALAPVFPTIDRGRVLIIDCGANMDSHEKNLAQFATMGDIYMREVYGIKSPRIGLLSVGDEDEKGNEMTKKAFALLKEMDINFVGNIEARYALSGKYDVIVTDGFAGNVLIKSIEGTASMMMKMFKQAVNKNAKSKLGGLLLKDSFKDIKNTMDYHAYGGAPLLGVNNVVVKSHGSSNAYSIQQSINQVIAFYKAGLVDKIRSAMTKGE